MKHLTVVVLGAVALGCSYAAGALVGVVLAYAHHRGLEEA